MDDVKYIKTNNDIIIVFPSAINHSAFKNFNPISAGFVSFSVNKNKEINVYTYGESVGLKLKPHKDDKFLIESQIVNPY